MPRVEVIFYREEDGSVPMLDWLGSLTRKPRVKCAVWLGRLEMFGYELKRPDADYLRDGIYELRVGLQGINYRMLYFFAENAAIVVSHGLVKERQVPAHEIDTALERKRRFEEAPHKHAFVWEGQ
jgi:phage-related protein